MVIKHNKIIAFVKQNINFGGEEEEEETEEEEVEERDEEGEVFSSE